MVKSTFQIERWDQNHSRWFELMSLEGIEHLDIHTRMADWHLGIYTLVALQEGAIAGVLRFWTQEIGIDEEKPPFLVDGKPAVEAKIVTFHVLEGHRRQGVGRALQRAAVHWARELGCYQIRSRSAYQHQGNHALKAALGFGINPARDKPDGPEDTAFFVLPLQLEQELCSDA